MSKLINLDREDLLRMVYGITPAVSRDMHPLLFDYGMLQGRNWMWLPSHVDRASEETLFELYQICKESYPNIRDSFNDDYKEV